MVSPRECRVCGVALSASRLHRNPNAFTCSLDCSKRLPSLLYQLRNPHSVRLPTATIGAISELVVAADLLQRGYQVFRALSPSSSCDLAILLGMNLLRVEVTTGSVSASGNLIYPKHEVDNFDIMAIYVQGKIIYVPDLPELSPETPRPTENKETVDPTENREEIDVPKPSVAKREYSLKMNQHLKNLRNAKVERFGDRPGSLKGATPSEREKLWLTGADSSLMGREE